MSDDLELSPQKMPRYEAIGETLAPQPSRLRRYVLLFVAVALVAGVIAAAVSSSRGAEAPNTGNPSGVKKSPTKSCSLATGISVFPITVGGIPREYKVHVPTGISFPASVVFAYHGISSSTDTIEGKMLLQPYQTGAAIKSIIVYPEAKNKGGGLLNPAAFNGAACCKNDPRGMMKKPSWPSSMNWRAKAASTLTR